MPLISYPPHDAVKKVRPFSLAPTFERTLLSHRVLSRAQMTSRRRRGGWL
jgi:hypothetical protein